VSNFKKQSLAFVLLLSLLQFTPVFAAAKSPSGQICKKKSATTTFAKQTFICKLVGKKLLWTLQVKKVVPPVQPVLSWAEIAAKVAADKEIADAKIAAEAKAAADKEIAEKAAAQAKEAAEKAAILAAQKPSIAGLQIGNLLWSEDFLGTSSENINSKNWSARNCHRVPVSDGGGACFGVESQYYAPSAISLDGSKDGAAVITTTRAQGNLPADAGRCLGDFGCKFVSGRFDTHNKVSFLYGYIEARIKMPSGSGNHPAFWMLGDNINQVGWPTTGEMDITEIHSNIPNETTAAINYSTSFAPNACCTNQNYVVEKLNLGSDVSQGYHLYALAWLPDSISYYADNKLVFKVTRAEFESKYGYWSFDKSFFIILNNAVSEGFSGSSANLQSSTMSIDWVRSYQVNGLGQVTIK
jgi:beta-glucanase (GH16 family)